MTRTSQIRLNQFSDEVITLNPTGRTIHVDHYQDATDLRDQLRKVQSSPAGRTGTVILLLNDEFKGNLPSIIRRADKGHRLIVTSSSGNLPGLVSRHDITFRAGMLGWKSLSFIPRLEDVAELVNSETNSSEAIEVLTHGD